MNLSKRISVLSEVGNLLHPENESLSEIFAKTEMFNPWFTRLHCELMVKNFREQFFNADKLTQWTNNYQINDDNNKTIGLVLAGNVPFVRMHDILSVVMSGNKAQVKLSSKDTFFFPWLHKQLINIEPEFENKINFVERLENFDAVIATGSNNSARYFNYYFGKYPNIIRRNRTSVAIITGNESDEEILELGKDVFYYYGLGCRNVSKIFIPELYDLEKLFRIWDDFRYIADNTKYNNNYDYNRALLLLNQTPHLTNDFFMIRETEDLFSPISVLFCERYTNDEDLALKINTIGADLQCVASNKEGNTPFGKTQFPELWDYADNVDTMKFLTA